MLSKYSVLFLISVISCGSYAGDGFQLTKVIVDGEDPFENIDMAVKQKIFIVDILGDPQAAGRLSCVCKVWNQIVNAETTRRLILMHDPTYAENLNTAGCKKLNALSVPALQRQDSELSSDAESQEETFSYIRLFRAGNSMEVGVMPTMAGLISGGLIGAIAGGLASNPLFFIAVPVTGALSLGVSLSIYGCCRITGYAK